MCKETAIWKHKETGNPKLEYASGLNHSSQDFPVILRQVIAFLNFAFSIKLQKL